MIYRCMLTIILLLAIPLSAQTLDMEQFKGMKARAIGPAGMSGRVTSIDVVLSNPDIIYAGTASGGLWRSTSGGIDWKPIFDDQPVASIGAVAVDQNNPDVIWVGTGEGNPRNSANAGDGVFKSLDGGVSWQFMGLKNSRNIHRLLLHPRDPNIAYTGVMGAAWGENEERGVYKTSDGGKTWQKILYVDEKTGVADLVMDPSNPNKLIAALWEYRRWPHFFKSGGPGSGLHVTYDGGETWKQRSHEDGLPKGDLGRIGLAIAPSMPSRVYALVEAKKNGLYRSDDGGIKWKLVSEKNIGNRPFYYHDIFVDPKNENRIYNLYSLVSVSEDAGKTFEVLLPFARIHPDHHAWWIHPEDPDFLIDGNDGGLAISRDRGKHWRFVENLPLAQFYHINVDMEIPYNVLGGMQDNGSWRGPSQVWRRGGIRNSYWEEVNFGDGFDVIPDPGMTRYGYAMSQGGFLDRYDLITGETKQIKPIHPEGTHLRYNWNAAFAQDPFDTATIYYGSQFLHKSTDRGNSWEIISPDLTSNDPEKQKQLESGGLTYDTTQAENFTTLVAIEPCPLEQGVIWTGSDDGHLQVTRDGGKNWKDVTKNIKGVPEGTWIPQIRASKHMKGAAYVVFDNHRRNDWTPYVYYTENYGKSWKSIINGDQVKGYALSIAPDHEVKDLLFLGTEFGLHVSLDHGQTWTKWTSGYPTVSTIDMVIHPRDSDLVIGTFGRSAYVLDDIGPLRTLAQKGAELMAAPLTLFPVPDTYLAIYKQASGTRFLGEGNFKGENRPEGALISFVVNKSKEKADEQAEGEENDEKEKAKKDDDKIKVKIEILNAQQEVIRTLNHKAEPGLNRVNWRLARKGVRAPSQEKPKKKDAPEPRGPQVAPGTYTVKLTVGEHSAETSLKVMLDPRIAMSEEDMAKREAFITASLDLMARATEATDRLREAKSAIKAVAERMGDREDEQATKLKDEHKKLKKRIKALDELINQKEVQGILRDPHKASSKIRSAMSYGNAWSAPNQTDQLALEQAKTALAEALSEIETFFKDEWPVYKELVDASAIGFFRD